MSAARGSRRVGRRAIVIGVSKAAEDARALADALGAHGADIDAELAQFEGVRRPIGERVMLHGRKLGAHLGVNLKTEDEWAMWKLLRDPHAVLGHIAVPHFLAA